MHDRGDNNGFPEQFAIENGASVNKSSGFYARGQRYVQLYKKIEVAATFELASSQAQQQEKKVKPDVVTRSCCVYNTFMMRIRHEFMVQGRMLSSSDIIGGAGADRRADAHTFDVFDRFVLLQLRTKARSCLLSSYADWLPEYTGTMVRKSAASRIFSQSSNTKTSL